MGDEPAREDSSTAYDLGLFAVYVLTTFALFVAGATHLVTARIEIAVLVVAVFVLCALSVRHRRSNGWRWPGMTAGDWARAALLTLFFGWIAFDAAPKSPLNAVTLPWYFGVLGMVTVATLSAFRVFRIDRLRPVSTQGSPESAPTLNMSLKSLRSIMAGLLLSYGFVSFFCLIWLDQTWHGAAPSLPNPALGFIYEANQHGSVRYYSAFQATACAVMFATSIPLAFLSAWIVPKSNLKQGFLRAEWNVDDVDGLYARSLLVGAIGTPPFVLFIGPYIIRALNAAGIIFNLG